LLLTSVEENSSNASRNAPNDHKQNTENNRLNILSSGNRKTVYPHVKKKHAVILAVQMISMPVYFERMTVDLDNPFVSMFISVPFDSSVDNMPLKTITITKNPICVTFLKNCVHESNAVGSASVMDIPSGISCARTSGMIFAIRGFVIPKIEKTMSIMNSLYVLVFSRSSFFKKAI
jgi:hypothetical protein